MQPSAAGGPLFTRRMAARALVVGLGNLTHPLTRHRYVFFPFRLVHIPTRYPVLGNLPWILSRRGSEFVFLRINHEVASMQRPNSTWAEGRLLLVYTRHVCASAVLPDTYLNYLKRGPHEHFWAPSFHGSSEDLPRAFLTNCFA